MNELLMSEREKMLAGMLYRANDPELMQMRHRAKKLFSEFNKLDSEKEDERTQLLQELIGRIGTHSEVIAPFYCDYGTHIELGDNVFINFNCVILDCAKVTIGNNVLLGPNVQLYAAHHPVQAQERIKGPELATPITIGDNVWLGGSVIVCPGVEIGENTTIGAGSVVTRNIPANVFAAGNPCRVIRHLTT